LCFIFYHEDEDNLEDEDNQHVLAPVLHPLYMPRTHSLKFLIRRLKMEEGFQEESVSHKLGEECKFEGEEEYILAYDGGPHVMQVVFESFKTIISAEQNHDVQVILS
jgi:hypothetical protein